MQYLKNLERMFGLTIINRIEKKQVIQHINNRLIQLSTDPSNPEKLSRMLVT
ncbi:MAG: hypothetical protein QXK95_05185 [Nitrososphaerota archaeon]|nr:hypothetical protein [Candidatus Geocrenenecus dongiae]